MAGQGWHFGLDRRDTHADRHVPHHIVQATASLANEWIQPETGLKLGLLQASCEACEQRAVWRGALASSTPADNVSRRASRSPPPGTSTRRPVRRGSQRCQKYTFNPN